MKKVTLENLATMIKNGFDENSKQHKEIFDRFNLIDKRFDKIEKKLEDVVHRNEFEKLEMRVNFLENILAIKKGK